MFQAESSYEGVRYFSLGQIVKNLTMWGVEVLLSAFFLVLSCENYNNLGRRRLTGFLTVWEPSDGRDAGQWTAVRIMSFIPTWEVRP